MEILRHVSNTGDKITVSSFMHDLKMGYADQYIIIHYQQVYKVHSENPSTGRLANNHGYLEQYQLNDLLTEYGKNIRRRGQRLVYPKIDLKKYVADRHQDWKKYFQDEMEIVNETAHKETTKEPEKHVQPSVEELIESRKKIQVPTSKTNLTMSPIGTPIKKIESLETTSKKILRFFKKSKRPDITRYELNRHFNYIDSKVLETLLEELSKEGSITNAEPYIDYKYDKYNPMQTFVYRLYEKGESRLKKKWHNGWLFRGIVLAIIGTLITILIKWAINNYQSKTPTIPQQGTQLNDQTK